MAWSAPTRNAQSRRNRSFAVPVTTNGPFRCDAAPYVYKCDYGKALTLADVGKSMSDVK